MRSHQVVHPVAHRVGREQAGFTMAEVLISLVVFIVAVVGVVGMQARAIEAQRMAKEMKGAERVAQETMADLMATGFNEFVEFDFAGTPSPDMPYDDEELGTETLADFQSVPADGTSAFNPGTRSEVYWVGRRVTPIPEGVVPAGDASTVDALQLDVLVMWIDTTNPAMPPTENLEVKDLVPENVEAGDENFKPWVFSVQLTTVRINDGI